MLVLTRRQDEEVIIGDHVVVKVVEVKGSMVRLGFEAPPEVTIYRREIHDEIRMANQMAANISPDDVRGLLK